MKDIKNKKQFIGILFLAGLLIILALSIFFIQSFLISTVLVLGLLLIATFLYNPKFGILLFLIIRPIIDNLGEKIEIPVINNYSLNITSLLGVTFLILSWPLILKNLLNYKSKLKNISLIAWIIFIGISTLSFFYSIDKFSSFYEIIRILTIFSFFLVALVFTESKKDLKLFINVLLFSAIIPFLIALYQLLTGTGLAGTTVGFDSRLYGTFSHPNQFASFALIIFGLSWFYYQQKKDSDKTKIIPMITSLLLLIATFSRGAWLGIIIFSLIFGLLKNFKIIIFVFLFIIFMFLTSETVNKRISDLYNPPATSSIYWRIERWTENYQSFIQKPLLGHGTGTELVVYEKDHGFYSKNNYTHNDLLKNAIEIGIIGTSSYLFLIFGSLFTLIKIYLRANSSFLKNFSLMILSIFIALNVFSMTSNIFRGTASQWTMWFLIGSCIGLYLKKSKK